MSSSHFVGRLQQQWLDVCCAVLTGEILDTPAACLLGVLHPGGEELHPQGHHCFLLVLDAEVGVQQEVHSQIHNLDGNGSWNVILAIPLKANSASIILEYCKLSI